MHIGKSRGPRGRIKGKSRAWRAKMRRRAEAEHARRKRAREAKRGAKSHQRQAFAADAESRFFDRQLLYAQRYGRAGRAYLMLTWLVHNCLAHPLLGLFPCAASVWLHDRSADWLNQSPVRTRSGLPQISSYRAWLVHNCLAHPAMGLAPLGAAFTAHDDSALRMRVPGWL